MAVLRGQLLARIVQLATGVALWQDRRDELAGAHPGSRAPDHSEVALGPGDRGTVRRAPCLRGVMSVAEIKIELRLVPVEKPDELNLILGQSHFIKTVEDLHEALAGAVPGLRFGLAFCESSGPRLVRRSGNDPELVELATRNALAIGAGHSFIVFLREGFPVNVLNQVKLVPEVCRIYCATANPVQVIVAETSAGRGILGVIDGASPLGVETETDVEARLELLRQIGYKL
jgi:adenosine/AMP kinase